MGRGKAAVGCNSLWLPSQVCFKEAVFSLLPRMRYGLFYNTPLVSPFIHPFSLERCDRMKSEPMNLSNIMKCTAVKVPTPNGMIFPKDWDFKVTPAGCVQSPMSQLRRCLLFLSNGWALWTNWYFCRAQELEHSQASLRVLAHTLGSNTRDSYISFSMVVPPVLQWVVTRAAQCMIVGFRSTRMAKTWSQSSVFWAKYLCILTIAFLNFRSLAVTIRGCSERFLSTCYTD